MKKTHLGMLVAMAALVFNMGIALAGSPKVSAAAEAVAGKGGAAINVLIDTSDKNYDAIVASIEAAGGSVSHRFEFVEGLAATIPASAFGELSGLRNVEKISLDGMRYPGVQGGYEIETAGTGDLNDRNGLDSMASANRAFILSDDVDIQVLPGADPETYYSYFPDSMNTLPMILGGNIGQGSLIAVIDTGTQADHAMLAGRVHAGVDLSTDVGTGFEGATLPTNHFHGTHVAGIAAGDVAFLFGDTSLLVASIEYYAGITLPAGPPGTKILPMLGTAPGAEIYPIKVFPHTGAGAPTSTIIAGIEHAINLHLGGTDVDVINMSLGGGTGFEGRDLESQVVDFATEVGIAVVVSAGNDGPSSQTIGSPSGAHTAITVGNAAHPVNTRVFWDFNYGLFGIGDLLYVDDNVQMLYSSSRGNTGDGRNKPETAATGTFVLSAFTGSPTSIGFASGTSMSSPAIAGVVALLNTASEAGGLGASPYDFKEAVMGGSNPLPGFEDFEQGAGYINAADAMAALMADGEYGSAHPKLKKGFSRKSKKPNGTQLEYINEDGGETFEIVDLPPGYVEHYWFNLHPNAERIIVDVTDVDYGFDPLFFNSAEFHVMSAQRTTDSGYYLYTTNVWGDSTFTIESMNTDASGFIFGVNTFDKPLMPGHVRLTIENDWTSYDLISMTVNVTVEHGNQSDKPDESFSGVVNTGDSSGWIPFGWGPNGVDVELSWKNQWDRYSSSDLDMFVFWCDSGFCYIDFGGATFSAPEIVEIDSNDITYIDALVDGYETYGVDEPWTMDIHYK